MEDRVQSDSGGCESDAHSFPRLLGRRVLSVAYTNLPSRKRNGMGDIARVRHLVGNRHAASGWLILRLELDENSLPLEWNVSSA